MIDIGGRLQGVYLRPELHAAGATRSAYWRQWFEADEDVVENEDLPVEELLSVWHVDTLIEALESVDHPMSAHMIDVIIDF
ncbi:hypothetical protein JW905_05785 [bacterium]|nr:hypothetical protein [candidate division CSSED10-310 bacterium]